MQEDMIDFPVSDLWREHYAAQGLTYLAGSRSPRRQIDARSDSDLVGVLREVRALRAELNELRVRLDHPHLAKTADASVKPPTMFDE